MARTGRKKEGKDSVDQERLAMEVVATCFTQRRKREDGINYLIY